MIHLASVISPTLDAKGQFAIMMDEFAVIKRDVVSRLTTDPCTAGTPTITMTDTTGFTVGQTVVIQDSLNHETCLITAVTPATSLTVAVNLTNTYTVARGGRVTVVDVTLPITGTATAAGVIIPMTNTTGLRAGQVIVIEDSLNAETCVVNVVTPTVQITVTANLEHTYTVARGGTVTVAAGNPARATVLTQKPFAAAAGSSEFYDVSWSVGVNAIVVTANKSDAAAGPVMPYTWAVAVTADVIGIQFTAMADGE